MGWFGKLKKNVSAAGKKAQEYRNNYEESKRRSRAKDLQMLKDQKKMLKAQYALDREKLSMEKLQAQRVKLRPQSSTMDLIFGSQPKASVPKALAPKRKARRSGRKATRRQSIRIDFG